MNGCPYRIARGKIIGCNAVSPWEEDAGKYPLCTTSEWAEHCPHYYALCREAEKEYAEVYARQARKRSLEALARVAL